MVFYSGDFPDNVYLILKGKVEVLIEIKEIDGINKIITSKGE
jgi:hypothetical protein